MTNGILKAATILGGQAELARALRVTPQAVSQWGKGNPVPVSRVMQVARITDWSVTPHELRPDIYPNPSDGLPAQSVPEHAA